MNTLTCHTPGCPSQGEPVQYELAVVNPVDGTTSYVNTVICGLCGQPITDIQPPIELGAPV